MHGIRLLLMYTFASCTALLVLSWWVYIPYYRSLLERRDSVEFERTRGWALFATSKCMEIALYFMRREYRRSMDASVHRHGSLIRWTFSFPLMLAVLSLLMWLTADSLLAR